MNIALFKALDYYAVKKMPDDFIKGYVSALEVAGIIKSEIADLILECYGLHLTKEYSEKIHTLQFEI